MIMGDLIPRLGRYRVDQWLIFALAGLLFYRQDVSNAWLLIALLVSVARIAVSVTRRDVRGVPLMAVSGLALICGVAYLSTVLQAPEYQEEYLRHLLVPFLLAIAIPLGFDSPDAVRRLGEAIAFGLLVLIATNLAQYRNEYAELGRIPTDLPAHRRYGDGLIVTMPVALAIALVGRTVWFKALAYLAVLTGLVMLLLTGMRGAWLGFGIAGLVVVVIAWRRLGSKFIGATLLLLLATISTALLFAPDSLVAKRFELGWSTTHRYEGTWKPTIQMIGERPLAGFGFGERIFHDAYNTRRPDNPEWFLKKSEGAHNSYLSLGFAAGAPALIIYVLILGGVIVRVLRRSAGFLERDSAHALLGLGLAASLTAAYGVHAIFETKAWAAFGVLMGASLAWLRVTPRAGET